RIREQRRDAREGGGEQGPERIATRDLLEDQERAQLALALADGERARRGIAALGDRAVHGALEARLRGAPLGAIQAQHQGYRERRRRVRQAERVDRRVEAAVDARGGLRELEPRRAERPAQPSEQARRDPRAVHFARLRGLASLRAPPGAALAVYSITVELPFDTAL